MTTATAASIWTGRSGLTNRKVYAALLVIAQKAGGATCWRFVADTRRISETAGISHKTTIKTLGRLIAAGEIASHRADKDDNTPIWYAGTVWELVSRIDTPLKKGTLPPLMQKASGNPERQPDPSHDLWRWGGAGAGTWAVYSALDPDQPKTFIDLSAECQVHRSTLYRALNNLRTHGLARQVDGGSWVRVAGDVDAAAKRTRAYGRGKAQRRRHQWERAVFRVRRTLIAQKDKNWSVAEATVAIACHMTATDQLLMELRCRNRLGEKDCAEGWDYLVKHPKWRDLCHKVLAGVEAAMENARRKRKRMNSPPDESGPMKEGDGRDRNSGRAIVARIPERVRP